ncbi:uncharacterized protein LOC116178415 [Photinus pyralis]|nr:uncharacterized protein LOC116178415 [Photinus pyralis]
MMGRHHVRELLEKYDVGTRIEFEHYLSLWRQSIGIPLNSYETGPTGSGMTRQLASTSIWVDNLEPSDIRSPCSSHHSTDAGSGAKVLLATILKDSPKAALLMEYWEKNSKFENEQRGALISLIARYFEDNRIPMTMAASYQLEREIVERFPTEKLEFYRTNKRGKLYNKWRNSNGRFNKAVLKKTEKTDTSRTDIALDSEKDAEDIIRSLRNDDLSAEELDRFWKACGNYRLNQIRTANSTAEIFKKWPQYKTPSGYRFIEFDFVILNRDSKDPSSIWEAGANKIIQFLANSIKDKELKTLIKSLDEDMEENGRNATILWLLHGFFVPSNRGTQTDINGKKKITKYTIRDSQQYFLYLGKSAQQVEQWIEHRKSKGTAIQPFLFAIAESLKEIGEVFVYFDDVKFKFYNIIRAMDICFKIFHVFNLEYPNECHMFWTFIETYLYNVKSNKSYTKVYELKDFLKSGEN